MSETRLGREDVAEGYLDALRWDVRVFEQNLLEELRVGERLVSRARASTHRIVRLSVDLERTMLVLVRLGENFFGFGNGVSGVVNENSRLELALVQGRERGE